MKECLRKIEKELLDALRPEPPHVPAQASIASIIFSTCEEGVGEALSAQQKQHIMDCWPLAGKDS